MYTAEFKAGQSYDRLHKCITINIIADGFHLNDTVHSEYVLQEKGTHTLLTDVLAIHFLNVQAAKRAKDENMSKQGQLITWLKFIGARNKEERTMLATTSPILQMLNEQIDVLSLSPVERKLYESRMKLKSDITTISENQFSAGMQQGMQRGIEHGKSLGLAEGKREGAHQKALETAKNLLQFGLSIENIAKVTDLTVQEVQTL